MTSKAEVWQQRLAACRSSGVSTAAFCRERGWSYAQCMYWQRRLGKLSGALVPVRVEVPGASGAPLSVELALPGSVSLRVHDASVADVVALVRGLSC